MATKTGDQLPPLVWSRIPKPFIAARITSWVGNPEQRITSASAPRRSAGRIRGGASTGTDTGSNITLRLYKSADDKVGATSEK